MPRRWLHIISETMSWLLLGVMLVLFVFSVRQSYVSYKTGRPTFFLGYRPVYVLTGSMEPVMKTHCVALTKQVTDLSDIAVGDIVTYHRSDGEGNLQRNDFGRTVLITHRVVDIAPDGTITTKGDANLVNDGLPLSISDVEAKVVYIGNWAAWVVNKWDTTTGKVMLISFALALVMSDILIHVLVQAWRRRKASVALEDNAECVIVQCKSSNATVFIRNGEMYLRV